MSTPQTSVLLQERACCRIFRATSPSMSTAGWPSRFAVVISIAPQNESSYGVWVARNISPPLREHIPSAPSKIELYRSRADGLLKGWRQLRQRQISRREL